MDTSKIGSDVLVSFVKITGQTFHQQDLSPPIVFLAPLVSVLTGVMFADGSVTGEEKQRWQKTIKHFIPSEPNAVQFAQQLSKGIREHKIYAKPSELLKLTQPLSVSERLLLLGLGYEMSAADGQMDESEKQYLRSIAEQLSVNPSHINVLEAGLVRQSVDLSALEEVRSLLDPARFHELDVMFVNAANNLLSALPTRPEQSSVQSHATVAYKQLEAFQQRCVQLDKLCFQIYQVVQTCIEKNYLTAEPLRVLDKMAQRLQSQRFRVAVVGEFSQGKSTLLNALLGEEIQPARAIPCSGTVTTLRYGSEKRVICRYKDGREVEIPIEQYKQKAAIPREVAQEKRSDSLAETDLDEIIFEHPELTLCRSGVEIVDSPGLNEHPDRTAITQKLLQNTDAAIFLTNAMRLLPEKEKELIQDVRLKLNGNQDKQPADNLFMVVNFIDLLEEAEDRQDVAQRLESFICNQNLLPAQANRVHYISAKAALKANGQSVENEYRRSFQVFTRSLEEFLTTERGVLQIAQMSKQLHSLLEASFDGLVQAELLLDSKVHLSNSDKQKILEQIGEASGRDIRIRTLANGLRDQVANHLKESLGTWIKELPKKMKRRSVNWHSSQDPFWQQKQIIQNFTDQFVRDLSQEIDDWSSYQFAETILKPQLELLDMGIDCELKAIQSQFEQIDLTINTGLSKQLNFAITGINDDLGGDSVWGGLSAGGAVAAALLVFTPIGLLAAVFTAVIAAIAGSFSFGWMNSDKLKEEIKNKVIEEGLKQFSKSTGKIADKLGEIIIATFDQRVEAASRVIEQAIALYENLLEQQEKSHAATLNERQQQQAWIAQQRQELQRLQQQLDDIVRC